MNITGAFHERIQQSIQNLDLAWFEKKKHEFLSHQMYDPGKEMIVIRTTKWDRMSNDPEDDEGELIELGDVVQIDLRSYCSSYLPIDEITQWGQWPVSEVVDIEPEQSNCTREEAISLVHHLSGYADRADINSIWTFISGALAQVKSELNKLTLICDSPIYAQALTDFHQYCSSIFYKKYERELTVAEISQGHTDVLNFDLTQDELASLLYIFMQSKILHDDKRKIVEFSQKYFQFKFKGDFKRSTTLKTLSDKINNASNYGNPKSEYEGHKPLMEISDRLMAILSQIKKG